MSILQSIKRQGGFTLVELIISLALFSFMLLIVTSSILSLFHVYEAGVQIRSTQKNTRLSSQQISADIHTAQGSHLFSPPSSPHGYKQDYLCLFRTIGSGIPATGSGEVYYTTLSGSSYLLHRRTFVGMLTSTCVITLPGADQILTDEDVSVEVFRVDDDAALGYDPSYVGVHFSILPVGAVSGSLVTWTLPQPTCNQSSGGAQYCSISNLDIGGTTHQELEN